MSSRRLIQKRLAEAAFHLDTRSTLVAGSSSTRQRLTVHAEQCADNLTSMLQLPISTQRTVLGPRPLHSNPQTSFLQAWRYRAAGQPASFLCRAVHSRSHPGPAGTSFPSMAARGSAVGGISPACLGRSRWRLSADRGGRAASAAAWTKEHSTAAYPPHLRGPLGGQAPGRSSTTSALAERLDAAPPAAAPGRATASGPAAPALHAREADGWLRAAEPSSQEEASHADRVTHHRLAQLCA